MVGSIFKQLNMLTWKKGKQNNKTLAAAITSTQKYKWTSKHYAILISPLHNIVTKPVFI